VRLLDDAPAVAAAAAALFQVHGPPAHRGYRMYLHKTEVKGGGKVSLANQQPHPVVEAVGYKCCRARGLHCWLPTTHRQSLFATMCQLDASARACGSRH
jgi:hypothetical protein